MGKCKRSFFRDKKKNQHTQLNISEDEIKEIVKFFFVLIIY
ncbi:hypothetical protein ES705_35867 [subsurface metagenome]